MTEASHWPDLAARRLGAGVIHASDEFFGEKENLLRPGPPVIQPHTFGHKGEIVDGWESRRRRTPGQDFALVRLGVAGIIHGVVVDTTGFTGNFPAACLVRACAADGYPGPEDLLEPDVEWVEIVPRSPLVGDAENAFAVTDGRRFTHVRLDIYPDGGVARLRVPGEVVPDPRLLEGLPLDLAAQENGGMVVDASDRFYSSPENLIAPGLAAVMGDGWETRRRRGTGNDWVLFQLAGAGHIQQAVLDTSYFLGNAPAAASLRACDATDTGLAGAEWFDLLPRTPLRPDTRHRFRTRAGSARPATHVRLDIHPDGGLARLRLYGGLTGDGRARLGLRWFDRLPATQATDVLAGECGLGATVAAEIASRRPFARSGRLEALLSMGETGQGPAGAAQTGEGPAGAARAGSEGGPGLAGLDDAAAERVRALILGG